MAHKEKKQKKSFGFFWTILFLLALSVFCFSAYQLFDIYRNYKQGVDEYLSVSHETVVRNQEPLVVKEQAETEEVLLVEPEKVTYQPPEVNFDELQQMNPDVLGWMEIEAIPDISYPVVQAEDNAYYLKHTFKKTENSAGSIFVDYINSPNLTDCNTIIYGHNMKNGTMFAALHNYRDPEFLEQYPYVYIYTETETRVYQIFAAYEVSDAHLLLTYNTEDADSFGWYLEGIMNNEETLSDHYNKTLDLNSEDKIISLETCISSKPTMRYLIQAVLVARAENEQ